MSATVHKGSVWHFSSTEIEHLTVATIAFTALLALLLEEESEEQF